MNPEIHNMNPEIIEITLNKMISSFPETDSFWRLIDEVL